MTSSRQSKGNLHLVSVYRGRSDSDLTGVEFKTRRGLVGGKSASRVGGFRTKRGLGCETDKEVVVPRQAQKVRTEANRMVSKE